MIIGGLQKFSLIDYPNHLSAIVFTKGCNFRCQYCYNPVLVYPEIGDGKVKNISSSDLSDEEVKEGYSQITENAFFDFLKLRVNKLDAIVITGGEPTIHSDLPEFIDKIKKFNFKIKLDTNGTNPEMLNKLISLKLLDYIAMDIKGLPQDYVNFFCKTQDIEKKIIKSIDIIMKNNIDYEFRTTCVSPFISLNVVSKLAPLLQNAKRWFFQECTNLENTLNPDFFKKKSNVLNRKELDKLVKVARNFVQNAEIR